MFELILRPDGNIEIINLTSHLVVARTVRSPATSIEEDLMKMFKNWEWLMNLENKEK